MKNDEIVIEFQMKNILIFCFAIFIVILGILGNNQMISGSGFLFVFLGLRLKITKGTDHGK